MMAEENRFPTISDFHRALGALIGQGFGECPAQLLVVTDSTLQAIAGDQPKPALMIDLPADDHTGRLPPALISIRGMETTARH